LGRFGRGAELSDINIEPHPLTANLLLRIDPMNDFNQRDSLTITELLQRLVAARRVNPGSVRCRLTASQLIARGMTYDQIESELLTLAE